MTSTATQYVHLRTTPGGSLTHGFAGVGKYAARLNGQAALCLFRPSAAAAAERLGGCFHPDAGIEPDIARTRDHHGRRRSIADQHGDVSRLAHNAGREGLDGARISAAHFT